MNILVTIVSAFSYKKEEKKYKVLLDDCDVSEVFASHTNESIFKTLIEMREIKNSGGINKVIALVSKKVLKEKDTNYEDKTAYSYYESLIKRYSPNIKIEKIETENENGIKEIAEILDELCKCINIDDVVYIDIAGGRRTTSNVIQLLAKLLKYKGVKNPYSLYSDINGPEGVISETSSFIKMTDLLDAFNEFMTTGKSYKLSECMERSSNSLDLKIKALLEAMRKFSDKIQIGNIENLDLAVNELEKNIHACERINNSSNIEIVILKQFLPVIKDKLIGDNEKISYIKIVKWCLDNRLIQQALTIFVEKIPIYIFEQGIIKTVVDVSKEKENYQRNRIGMDPADWEVKVFYTDILNINNDLIGELKKCLKGYEYLKTEYVKTEKVRNVLWLISQVENKWGKLRSLYKNDDKFKYIDNFISENNFKSFKKFKNVLCNKNDLLAMLLDIKKEKNRDENNSIKLKFDAIKEIKNGKGILPPFTLKCSNAEMADIYYGYIYVKILRNQINHASSNDVLTYEQRNILRDAGYSFDIANILSIQENIEKALHAIEIVNKNNETQKEKEKNQIITPTDLKIGDIVTVTCVDKKKVRLKSYDYDIQLVLSHTNEPLDLLNKTFEVEIRQISKAGKIIQVKER